ncbi:BRO1 domain-containing protein BROX-like, partial [Saccoglossus kowalevskii]|uniref:BRO1 domain-containing protein BROX-like n=1 Tax=Saccoglossus kowalevskii TaxID=10224 RepID=A0ABM0GV32_SACKO
MAHWFHRNPIKATAVQKFDLRSVATTGPANKMCSDLREARSKLLEIVSNPNIETSAMKTAVEDYFSLLEGFIQACDEKGGESKLRYILNYKWTNSLMGYEPSSQQDVIFEMSHMLINIGLWYTKHASKVAGEHEEVSMDDAKDCHTCLKTAAGIFNFVKENLVGKLLNTPEKGEDLDSRILTAYLEQCTAEAQEVTVARAIELKHNSGLVSGLAHETAKLFRKADDSLTSLDVTMVAKWRKYLQLKYIIYMAYAHCFNGTTLLGKDKCGDSIKSLQESKKFYEKACQMCKDYASTKGPGSIAKPENHLFFRKLGPMINRTLEKSTRENGFIYFHKVPEIVPELEDKASYGLANPDQYTPPAIHSSWKPELYSAFDISKVPSDGQNTQDKKKDEEIKP